MLSKERAKEIRERIEEIYDLYDSDYGRARMSSREWYEYEAEIKKLRRELVEHRNNKR